MIIGAGIGCIIVMVGVTLTAAWPAMSEIHMIAPPLKYLGVLISAPTTAVMRAMAEGGMIDPQDLLIFLVVFPLSWPVIGAAVGTLCYGVRVFIRF